MNFSSYILDLSWIQRYSQYELGFYLQNGPFYVINIDNCQDLLDNLSVQAIISHFPHAYIEISPSVKGIHLIGLGEFSHCRLFCFS